MMKTNNYNEYDKLVLYVKKEKLEEIVEHYILFGWELESQKENDRYEDILDVVFSRPHKIENKDELQLLQVHMEERLNKKAKIDKHKNGLITAAGLCMGSILAGIITILVLSLFDVLQFGLVIKILLGVSIVCLIVIECLFLPKIYKYEKEKYKIDYLAVEDEINAICERVKILVGDAYEK